MSSALLTLIYLGAAVCYVVGLHLMRNPANARLGNALSAIGMICAVIAAITMIFWQQTYHGAVSWLIVGAGLIVGASIGVVRAKTVKMTAMPELVSLFNAVGGGAAATIGLFDFLSHTGTVMRVDEAVTLALDIIIGSVTFSGSLIATGKLAGKISGNPIMLFGGRFMSAVCVVCFLVCMAYIVWFPSYGTFVVPLLFVSALLFGVLLVLPIGGADMPVVVSLLNAFTGLAVAMAGFVLNAPILIIPGALVGAAGSILTLQMAQAMNRSVWNIIVGGFGTDSVSISHDDESARIQTVSAEDAGLQLAYAHSVMIVPGYGLAAAQAQHETAALAKLLTEHGIEVSYAIHPVAGRMPGHMNVLLAEANVPYEQMLQLEEANERFATTDVSLVIGANDVVNPAARKQNTAISGMPILDVDRSKSVIVIKRSMGVGYAGIANELYTDTKTRMLFADAKKALVDLTASVKEYIDV